MTEPGRLEKIWIKRARRGPMDERPSARAVVGSGLEGNAHQGGKRQVTILSVESWRDAAADVEGEPDPILRRANLLVSGVDLEKSRGKTLQVGEVAIKIRGETRPCRQMDEGHPGLRSALDPHWRAGAFGQVVTEGELKLGDEVRWL